MRLSRDTYRDRLRSLGFFADCSKKELREVSALTTEVDIAAGRVLVDADHRIRQVFVIAEGSAEVRIGNRLLARLAPGTVFDAPASLPSAATVSAATTVVVFVLSDREFRSLPERVRGVAERLLAGSILRQAAPGDVDAAEGDRLDAGDIAPHGHEKSGGPESSDIAPVEITPLR